MTCHRTIRTRYGRAAAAAAAVLTLALAGCSDTDSGTTPAKSPSSTPAEASALLGPACAGLPSTGPGSPTVMADQPAATAVSQNPALSTLVSAITKAGLVDTLNSAQAITVFAPTNDAFAKIPKDTLNQVLADKATLTKVLTYHVVDQRKAPTDLAAGKLATLQGGTITTAKSGDTYTANNARVICGNIQTRNATVYLIDAVLMPPT
jgi:uncharacterized surface protein with fasciclin (FAS1) repeats